MLNPGFLSRNTQVPQRSGCFIVVGQARGGTSALASALNALGIFMGEDALAPNYEDRKLVNCIPPQKRLSLKRRDWTDFQSAIREYETRHTWWGFKYPSLNTDLEKIHQLLKNPRYIFVYRDVLAISNRRSQIFQEHSHFEFMRDCLKKYASMINFAEKYALPSLHVSYEKMLTNTAEFAEALCIFCQINASSENIQKVVDVITPSPKTYTAWAAQHKTTKQIEAAGSTGYKGAIGPATILWVKGWATHLTSNTPVELAVYVDDELHGTILANARRPFLLSKNITNTETVGFCYRFGAKRPSPDAIVSVKIKGTEIELANSGKPINELAPKPHPASQSL